MVKINNRYDDIISQDPAYQGSKPVDAVNEFMSKFIGQPIKKKLESKEQALLEAGELIAKPFSFLGKQISSPDVTIQDLQKTATTDPGLTGLAAQVQVPFEALGETLQFIFDPQFYSDLRGKINRGEATGFERGLGVVSALAEIAGGDELLRFAIKKFGPGIRTFFDNLSPEEKADPIAVINKMPISKQQKVELGQEILGGGKTVENIQDTIMREPDMGGAGGTKVDMKIPKTYQTMIDKNTLGGPETKAKIEKVFKDYPDKLPGSAQQISKDYGMSNYKYLLATIYKRMSEGTLPSDYFSPQLKPGEFAGKQIEFVGSKKAAELSKQKFGPRLEEIETYYAANKSKFKDKGVGFFKTELLKNTSVKSVSDKYLYDKFSGYEDIKMPGMKKDVYNKNANKKGNQKKAENILARYGIYGSERARSRNNFYTLVHSYRQDPRELEKLVKASGGLTKDEFKKLNPNLTSKEINEAYPEYSFNVGQKMIDDEYRMLIDLNEPENLPKFQVKIKVRDEFNKWLGGQIDEYFFNPNPTPQQAAFIEKFKTALSRATKKDYDDDKAFRKALISMYKTDLSHAFPIRAYTKEFPGAGGFADLIKVNFSGINTGQQAAVDRSIKRFIKNLSDLPRNPDGGFKNTPENVQLINKIIKNIQKINDDFGERLVTSIHKIDDPEVAALLKGAFPDRVDEKGKLLQVESFDEAERTKFKESKPSIVLGADIGNEPNLEDLKQYWLDHIRDGELGIKEPKFIGKTGASGRRSPLAGIMGKIAPGTPDFSFFNRGGPVRMAIGGDPLQNINQQQFTPDPAIDNDFFQQAVDSGNLQAFGASNLFKIFGRVPGLLSPKKVTSDIPTGTGTTPMVPKVDPGDFPFKSYFIESTTSPNAPKSALPKDWLKYYTGNIGVPQSEMKDAGILNYLEDIEKFFPNTKLTQQNLIDVYESSPIANIEVKVKREPTGNTPPGGLGAYMGKPKHKGTGSQPLDSAGENYREIVVNVDKLPGQETQFFNASHFAKDPNVIAFTRVADYKDVDGNTVAVIQEMQTDMLTNLKKEQERMKATAEMVRNFKVKLKEQIANGDTYQQDLLERFEREYPESMLQFMETSDLVRPNDPTFASQLTPDVVKELTEIQERITTIANQNRDRVVDPDFQNKIVALQEEGRQKFNALFELNRGTNYKDQLKNIRVLDVDNTEDLANFVNRNPTYMGSNEFRPVQSFPVLPFNKGKDYIDLLLKATIKDAEANGINKVAIFPSELVNRRWGKDPDGPAGKKFKTIYDNITVQELKNIAKKYTGNKNNLKIEKIVDAGKGKFGLKFFNKGVDGKDVFDQTDGLDIRDAESYAAYFDARAMQEIENFGDGKVMVRREIAPGQFSEFILKSDDPDTSKGYKLVDPTGDEGVIRVIEEYDPSLVEMYVLTLPEETTKKGPMFIYGKKDGGKIASDGLVSITDIFGEY